MRRAEGVVDEEVGRRGELLRELGHVLLLLLVEARVLEEEHVAVGHLADARGDAVADAVRRHHDVLAEQLRQARSHGAERELVLGAVLRAAQVGRQQHLRALLHEVLDGRHRRADARVVRDRLAVERHIQVAAHQDDLALQIRLREVADGLLGHLDRRRTRHARRRDARERRRGRIEREPEASASIVIFCIGPVRWKGAKSMTREWKEGRE